MADHESLAPFCPAGGEYSIGQTYVFRPFRHHAPHLQTSIPSASARATLQTGFLTPILIADYEHPKYENMWTVLSTYRQPLWGAPSASMACSAKVAPRAGLLEKDYYPSLQEKPGAEREIRFASEFRPAIHPRALVGR